MPEGKSFEELLDEVEGELIRCPNCDECNVRPLHHPFPGVVSTETIICCECKTIILADEGHDDV